MKITEEELEELKAEIREELVRDIVKEQVQKEVMSQVKSQSIIGEGIGTKSGFIIEGARTTDMSFYTMPTRDGKLQKA